MPLTPRTTLDRANSLPLHISSDLSSIAMAIKKLNPGIAPVKQDDIFMRMLKALLSSLTQFTLLDAVREKSNKVCTDQWTALGHNKGHQFLEINKKKRIQLSVH